MNKKDAAILEFFSEVSEVLERVSVNLSKVESDNVSDGLVNEIYRDVHSLKGNAALFGFKGIATVAHVLESRLDSVKHYYSDFSVQLIDSIYEGMDLVKSLCDEQQLGKKNPLKAEVEAFISKLVAQTSRLMGGEIILLKETPTIQENLKLEQDFCKNLNVQTPRALENNKMIPENKELTKVKGATMGTQAVEKDTGGAATQPESLRVRVDILDKLMNLVGELVLVRNQHLQNETKKQDSTDASLNQRLNIVTGELQEEVMKTRMQPIGTILTKYQRVIRDLSKELGKKVSVFMEGNETELDKTLLEAVKDPIMHIVRNSVDHGIESPEERKNVGKSPEGVVKIKSYHEGGQVIVEIEDDGKGLNRNKIAEKAIEKGLTTLDKVQNMADRDVLMFIFAPGFSTAEKVSNVSGRGVGMDVVRTNIDQIGGMIDLSSIEGKGTTIRIKIPLTLAIIPALIVRSGGERFAIPQVKLVELVRLEKDDEGKAIGLEHLQGEPVYRLRGKLLPLVGLNGVLGLNSKIGSSDSENIAVLNADTGTFGLVIDEIDDSADIVVKPLMQFIKDKTIYSGATVLGDGSVALAIDVMALANKVGILSKIEKEEAFHHTLDSEDNMVDRADYLLVNVGSKGSFAIPLCLVNRLEEFDYESIELSGEMRVVQYRGGLLPIFSVNDFLKLPSKLSNFEEQDRKCSVVVIQKSGKLYGLEVNEIIDVVNVKNNIDPELIDRPGVLGSMVVNKEVAVLIDVYAIIESFLFRKNSASSGEESKRIKTEKKILVVEDNSFFRMQVQRILGENGFDIILATNGEEGLNLLEQHSDDIALILSDIQMPVMDGVEMAKAIRKNDKYREIPLLALSTLHREKDIEIAIEAGFTKFLEKLNPEMLIDTMENLLNEPKVG